MNFKTTISKIIILKQTNKTNHESLLFLRPHLGTFGMYIFEMHAFYCSIWNAYIFLCIWIRMYLEYKYLKLKNHFIR